MTTGVYTQRWKVEGSVFNGREPDPNRADFDLAPLDSVSGRLSFSPTRRLALQVSSGHLHASVAEFHPQPRSNVNRTTASATYHRADGSRAWATTIAYGRNAGPEVLPAEVVHLVTHAGLLETSLTLRDRHMVFSRLEVVGKPAHELHAHEFTSQVFPVGKLETGYARQVGAWRGLTAGVGGVFSVNAVPPELRPYYSGRFPIGLGLFLTLHPGRHEM